MGDGSLSELSPEEFTCGGTSEVPSPGGTMGGGKSKVPSPEGTMGGGTSAVPSPGGMMHMEMACKIFEYIQNVNVKRCGPTIVGLDSFTNQFLILVYI